MDEPFEIVYCPHHLAIHDSEWCTAGDHEGLGTTEGRLALAEARRRGRTFYHGDVVNFRDSADDPKVGEIVGDKRAVSLACHTRTGYRHFHRAYLREVILVDDTRVTWRRPGGSMVFVCSRKTWKRWGRGAWRCGSDGVSTRRRFWD